MLVTAHWSSSSAALPFLIGLAGLVFSEFSLAVDSSGYEECFNQVQAQAVRISELSIRKGFIYEQLKHRRDLVLDPTEIICTIDGRKMSARAAYLELHRTSDEFMKTQAIKDPEFRSRFDEATERIMAPECLNGYMRGDTAADAKAIRPDLRLRHQLFESDSAGALRALPTSLHALYLERLQSPTADEFRKRFKLLPQLGSALFLMYKAEQEAFVREFTRKGLGAPGLSVKECQSLFNNPVAGLVLLGKLKSDSLNTDPLKTTCQEAGAAFDRLFGITAEFIAKPGQWGYFMVPLSCNEPSGEQDLIETVRGLEAAQNEARRLLGVADPCPGIDVPKHSELFEYEKEFQEAFGVATVPEIVVELNKPNGMITVDRIIEVLVRDKGTLTDQAEQQLLGELKGRLSAEEFATLERAAEGYELASQTMIWDANGNPIPFNGTKPELMVRANTLRNQLEKLANDLLAFQAKVREEYSEKSTIDTYIIKPFLQEIEDERLRANSAPLTYKEYAERFRKLESLARRMRYSILMERRLDDKVAEYYEGKERLEHEWKVERGMATEDGWRSTLDAIGVQGIAGVVRGVESEKHEDLVRRWEYAKGQMVGAVVDVGSLVVAPGVSALFMRGAGLTRAGLAVTKALPTATRAVTAGATMGAVASGSYVTSQVLLGQEIQGDELVAIAGMGAAGGLLGDIATTGAARMLGRPSPAKQLLTKTAWIQVQGGVESCLAESHSASSCFRAGARKALQLDTETVAKAALFHVVTQEIHAFSFVKSVDTRVLKSAQRLAKAQLHIDKQIAKADQIATKLRNAYEDMDVATGKNRARLEQTIRTLESQLRKSHQEIRGTEARLNETRKSEIHELEAARRQFDAESEKHITRLSKEAEALEKGNRPKLAKVKRAEAFRVAAGREAYLRQLDDDLAAFRRVDQVDRGIIGDKVRQGGVSADQAARDLALARQTGRSAFVRSAEQRWIAAQKAELQAKGAKAEEGLVRGEVALLVKKRDGTTIVYRPGREAAPLDGITTKAGSRTAAAPDLSGELRAERQAGRNTPTKDTAVTPEQRAARERVILTTTEIMSVPKNSPEFRRAEVAVMEALKAHLTANGVPFEEVIVGSRRLLQVKGGAKDIYLSRVAGAAEKALHGVKLLIDPEVLVDPTVAASYSPRGHSIRVSYDSLMDLRQIDNSVQHELRHAAWIKAVIRGEQSPYYPRFRVLGKDGKLFDSNSSYARFLSADELNTWSATNMRAQLQSAKTLQQRYARDGRLSVQEQRRLIELLKQAEVASRTGAEIAKAVTDNSREALAEIRKDKPSIRFSMEPMPGRQGAIVHATVYVTRSDGTKYTVEIPLMKAKGNSDYDLNRSLLADVLERSIKQAEMHLQQFERGRKLLSDLKEPAKTIDPETSVRLLQEAQLDIAKMADSNSGGKSYKPFVMPPVLERAALDVVKPSLQADKTPKSARTVAPSPPALASLHPKEQATLALAFEAARQTVSGGAVRAAEHGSNWRKVGLDDMVQKFMGASPPNITHTATGKVVIKSTDSRMPYQIVIDPEGGYARLQRTDLGGKRVYADVDGQVPNNIVENGKTRGASRDEYEKMTHFVYE